MIRYRPSVHEEEEKPTSATLALEAYSAQAPMDDGYAEEDYVHMTRCASKPL